MKKETIDFLMRNAIWYFLRNPGEMRHQTNELSQHMKDIYDTHKDQFATEEIQDIKIDIMDMIDNDGRLF